ncbi:type I restriction endonuclease subunit R [Neorhizobium alkalisoli]|uniref:Type I restriction enzyme endonuclease subunit n=1 Tax=Neorhizobium alkalisoli TaxID=528178 RepID=A0A561Q868_9HYPH|nr:type I restriction endonuclease subunit R [Neorhizobium alkalisoli]TWF46561.1 type I restriction enzyme R subunit [Neorhizobium alkalisoli]
MFEQVVEQATLGWFEALGYDVKRGAEISPGADIPTLRSTYEDVVLLPRLKAALRRINPNVPEEAIVQASTIICRPPEAALITNNRWLHRLLTGGVDVEYRTPDGDIRGDKVKVVDDEDPDTNDFLVVSQLTIHGPEFVRRPDIVVYINGLPISVLEIKDPSSKSATLSRAFEQIRDYRDNIPALFVYNQILMLSDGDTTRVGSLTSAYERFTPWRSTSGHGETQRPTLESAVTDLFRRDTILEYILKCITYDEEPTTGALQKKIAGYHQFRAVRSATRSSKLGLRPEGDGRGGVVWHTQGSGKSLTMLMLAGALITDIDLQNPTIVIVTDRNDLDGQLYETFASGRDLLRQMPQQAENREDLIARLDRASGGVIFTTIQKFSERSSPVSERNNIIVLADEAHRSQYGFVSGGARWMREALPNATFVGFTGTPIESSDRITRAVFGDYVDIYDIKQAVEDNATVKIYYEMRLIRLLPDENGLAEAEFKLHEAFEAEKDGEGVPPDISIPLEELAGAAPRLQKVAEEIINHFEKRLSSMEGKAMIVCMSREISMNLYDEIVRVRPEWHDDDDDKGFIKVVMDAGIPRNASAETSQRIKYHGRTKGRREYLSRRLKDSTDDLKMVIVCDMWLTGFDCPPLHTMYLDKPLAGHNLMQAIARVNRVFGDKPGGVVVDFLGVADQLKDAIQVYSQAGGEGNPVESIQQRAVPEMLLQYEALRDFFDGFDYEALWRGKASDRLDAVVGGANHVLGKEDGKRRFMNMVAAASKAFALSVPHPETTAVRDHLAFYQSVRAAIQKRLGDDAPLRTNGGFAVRQLISDAVSTGGVIDLFEASGLPDANIGILSDDFLDKLAALPQKNLALEAMKKLLAEQIKNREQINLVQSRSFRESLEATLARYSNRAITTAQVIDELVSLARFLSAAITQGKETGLSDDEIAFYEALADNESARRLMKDDKLQTIARELAESIKKRASLDWTQRETVRADMRRTIRRLLAKHGYPPDAQEAATQLVIKQAELMADRELV